MGYQIARPLLSIVTVSFEDEPGLRRTLNSLRNLAEAAPADIEFLVQDGGSRYPIKELAAEFPWVHLLTEEDDGIYDAMNRGIERAQGEFIWFLNGGDECLINDFLELSRMLASGGEVVLAGYQLDMGSRQRTRHARRADYINHALPTSHQAIFYRRSAIGDTRYDQSFSVSADYQFTAELIARDCAVTSSDMIVARFSTGGISSVNARQVARDAW